MTDLSIILMIFWFDVLAAFVSGMTGHSVWCVFNIVMAILLALMAMVYEGRLIARIKNLEEEVEKLKRAERQETIL